MEKILKEIQALRTDQEANHKELTNKILRNSTLFTDACAKISSSLEKLSEEYQQSKANFETRITALETDSVKNSQVKRLKELSISLES